MRSSRLAVATILLIIGFVWVGQGAGLIGGSFMTGSTFWGTVGIACVGVGSVILLLERRHRVGGT